MKLRILPLLSALLFLSASYAVAQMHPRPPGMQQAEKAQTQAERNIPPPGIQRSPADLAEIREQAEELARLAQTIPSDMTSVRNGMLPKDAIQKLKEIEKLSKCLRSELKP